MSYQFSTPSPEAARGGSQPELQNQAWRSRYEGHPGASAEPLRPPERLRWTSPPGFRLHRYSEPENAPSGPAVRASHAWLRSTEVLHHCRLRCNRLAQLGSGASKGPHQHRMELQTLVT